MEALREFATEAQEKVLDAVINCSGNKTQAAKTLKINIRSVQRTIKAIEKKAAMQGHSPEHDMTKPAAPGFAISGTSTLYDVDGNIKIQWVKTQLNKEKYLDAVKEALLDVFDEYEGKSQKIRAPIIFGHKDLLAVYPMGDPHLGMYAWADECGEDFDCDIAKKNLCDAVDNLVDRSPPAHTAIILNLGDFFHADNQSNQTSQSGNSLDVDSRWARVIKIGVQAMIQCVYSALKKHKKVVVRNVIGNHDDHSSQMLSIAMDLFFSNNPRVVVDDSPSHFWYYQHGKVLLGSTHGDMAKPDKLEGIMAADKKVEWGQTDYRYWLTGHIHNQQVKEFAGCVWESFRTLAAKDAWHSAMGYRAGRDMKAIIYHKDFGEVERHTMSIAMLKRSK